MKTIARVLATLTVLGLASCSVVTSTAPLGDGPHVVRAEDWDGTWLLGNGATCTVRVVDGEAGVLEAVVVADENGQLESHTLKVHLRDHGDWTFASIQGLIGEDAYVWSRLYRDDEQVILWAPDAEHFADLVAVGELPGQVQGDGDDVELQPLRAEQLSSLQGGLDRGLFKWEQPIAMIRLNRNTKW